MIRLILLIFALLFPFEAFAQGTSKVCKATAAAPTFNEGQTVELSCALDGTLRSTGSGGGGGGDGAINDGVSSSIKATVKDYTNSNPLAIIPVDTNGDPASLGGGTQYSQGTASTDTDTLTMAGCVRVDTPGVATGVADGDRARCAIDNLNRLWVRVHTIDGGTITSITNPIVIKPDGTVWTLTGTSANVNLTNASLAVTGTFWQATQPVSGTFWQATQPVSAAALPLPSGASTLAEQQTQTTSLQLIDDAVHASDAAVSKGVLMMCQFDDTAPGTTTENNTRFLRCSTRRELYGQIRDAAGNERGANVNASNQLSVSVDNTPTVALSQTSTNNDVDIASLPNEGQQTMASSISVALASDQQVPDPCTWRAKSYAVVSISSAATTQLVAASASNKLYVCGLHLITAGANNVAMVEDDTSACASPTAGMAGGTTAATGWNFASNSGLTLGSGNGTVAVTAATNRYVCLITSAAVQLSGGLSYVLAP